MPSEEFKVKVGVELDDSSLSRLAKDISGHKVEPIKIDVKLQSDKLKKELNTLRKDLQEILKISAQIGKTGFGSTGSATKGIQNEAQRAFNFYKQAHDYAKQLYNTPVSKNTAQQRKELEMAFKEAYGQYEKIATKLGGLNSTAFNGVRDKMQKVVRDSGIEIGKLYDNVQVKQAEAFVNKFKELNKFKAQRLNLVDEKDAEQIKVVDAEIRKLETDLRSMAGNVNRDILRGMSAEMQKSSAEVAKARAKLADSMNRAQQKDLVEFGKITSSGNIAKMGADVSALEQKFNGLSASVRGSSTIIKELREAQSRFLSAKESGDIQKTITAYQNYNNVLTKTKAKIKEFVSAQKTINSERSLSIQKDSLSQNIDRWLSYNSGASEKFKNQMREIQRSIQTADATRLDGLTAEFKRLDAQAELAGQKVMSFGDRLKMQFTRFSSYFSVATVFMQVGRAARSAFENVKNLDTAMTELRKVTNESDSTYTSFLEGAKSKAVELSTTMTDYINSTADFARLGYDFMQAQDLASVASKYNVVGDDLEGIDQATEHLISTMRAFQMESSGAISIVDKLNEVSNNFAVTSGNLGSGLEVASSALSTAGNDLDQTIALITGGTEITQDANSTARGIRTIALRIRGMDKELEDLGEDTEGMITYTPKLRKELQDMAGVDIMDGTGQSLRSTYDILGDLAHKWGELNDIQKAGLTESLAGKNRANVFNALMTNWSQVEDAYETAKNSAGSADAEFKRYQESIQAKLNQLKASLEGLSETALGSDFLKGAIDGLRGFVETIDWVLDKIGAFPLLLSGLFTAFTMKNSRAIWNPIVESALSSGNKAGTGFTKLFQSALNQLSDGRWFSKIENNAKTSGAKAGNNFISGFGRALANLTFGKTDVFSETAMRNFSAVDDLKKLFSTDFNTGNAEAGIKRIDDAFMRMSSSMKNALSAEAINASSLKDALSGTAQDAKKLASTLDMVSMSQKQLKVESLASTKSFGAMKTLVDEFNNPSSTGLTKGQLVDSVKKSWSELGNIMDAQYQKQQQSIKKIYTEQRKMGKTASEAFSVAKAGAASTTLSFNTVTASLVKTRVATIALKGAFMTLQAVGAMLVFMLAGQLISGVSKLAHHFEEVRQKSRDTATDVANSVQNVNSSLASFANTRELYAQGSASKDELASASQALAEAMGLEENQVAYLTEKYHSLSDGMSAVISGKEEMITSVSNATAELSAGIQALGTDWNKLQNGKDNGAFNLFGLFGADNGVGGTKQAAADLANSMNDLISKSKEYQALVKNGTMKDMSGFQWFKDGARSSAQLAQEYERHLTVLSNYEHLSEKDQKKLERDYKKAQKYVANNKELYEEFIKDRNAQISSTMNTDFMEKTSEGLPKTQAQFKALREEMARNLASNKELGLSYDEALTHVDGMLGGMSTLKNFLEGESLGYEALEASLDGIAEKIQNVNTAMTESVSGTGLTAESIENVTKAYGDLDSFDPEKLFERTANGISLNTEELQRLQEEQSQLKIKELNDELTRMTKLRDEASKAGDKDGVAWYDSQIAKCKDLIAQYEGATSAYSKWQQALSSANEGAMYDNITSQLENMKKLRDEGLVGTDDFKTFVGLMSDDTAGKNAYQLQEIFDKGYPKLKKYFTEGSSGAEAFLKELNKLDSSWAHMGKDGWEINLDNVSLKDVSDKLAEDGVLMSQEAIEIMARKLRDYGFDIDLDSQINIDGEVHGEDEIVDKVEDAIGKVNDALVDAENKTVYKIDIDVDATADGEGTKNLEYQLNHAKELIDALKADNTIDVNVRDAQINEAQVKLYALLQTLHDPNNILTIDTSSMDYNARTATEKVQNYIQAVVDRDYQARIGADTSEADKKLEETKQKLSTLTDEDYKKLGIEVQIEGEDKATQSAKKIRKAIEGDKAVTVKYKTEEEGSGKKKQETVEVKQTPDPLDVHVPDVVSVHLEGTLTVPEVKPVKVKLEAGNVITPKVKTGQAKVNYNKIGKQAKPKAQSTTVNYSKLGKQTNPKAKDTKVNYSKIGSQKNPSAKSASISYTPIKYQEPPKNKTAKVTYTNTGGSASGTARVTNPTSSSRRISGMTQLYGTAHAQGTAFKGGNWGARESGVALMAEVAPELLVHNGKWQLVGEDGAGFYSYQKGDINKIVSVYSNVYEKFI